MSQDVLNKKSLTKKKLFILIFLILLILGSVAVKYFDETPFKKKAEIHLAIAGPMNQESDAGVSFYRAAKLVIDKTNESLKKRELNWYSIDITMKIIKIWLYKKPGK